MFKSWNISEKIGITSHIEQLKNSVDTQIHVVKKGGGVSDRMVVE